jgi:hypothetical protein
MDLTTIEVLFEGATEEKVLAQLCKEIKHESRVVREKICHQTLKPTSAKGQGGIPSELDRILRNLPLVENPPHRLLIVWDRDNKDHSARCNSVLSVVRRFASEARLEKLSFDNVYILHDGPDNLRLALCIASDCCDLPFDVVNRETTTEETRTGRKATTDDYVLKLALRESTASRLLTYQKKKRPDWKITTEKLIEKITKEIPELLMRNGIPLLPDAKEYVRFYAAILSLHTSPPVFAETTLAHANEDDIKEVFAPLLAAIQHLESAL